MAPLMKFLLRGTVAAVLALACAAPAADAANVTVRVEGSTTTLLAPTSVSTGAGTFTKSAGAPACQAASAGGALELATAGAWSGAFDGNGQRVETILGEEHLFTSGRYWSIWVNKVPADEGACTQPAPEGTRLTFFPGCAGATSGCFDGMLELKRAPANVQPGQEFEIAVDALSVVSYNPAPPYSNVGAARAVGATVTVGGSTATTAADGVARVRAQGRGVQPVKIELPGFVRASGAICVTDGTDGECGTPKPGQVLGAGEAAQTVAQVTGAAPCTTNGGDGLCGSRDLVAPFAALSGLKDRQVFPAGKGPRALSGTLAADPSGILMVKLRIHRRAGERCSYFSGRQERFRAIRCGVRNAKWFKIGDRADWSYLLPSRLPKGEYVIDVNAIDKAYNRDDARERGRNRVFLRVG